MKNPKYSIHVDEYITNTLHQYYIDTVRHKNHHCLKIFCLIVKDDPYQGKTKVFFLGHPDNWSDWFNHPYISEGSVIMIHRLDSSKQRFICLMDKSFNLHRLTGSGIPSGISFEKLLKT